MAERAGAGDVLRVQLRPGAAYDLLENDGYLMSVILGGAKYLLVWSEGTSLRPG